MSETLQKIHSDRRKGARRVKIQMWSQQRPLLKVFWLICLEFDLLVFVFVAWKTGTYFHISYIFISLEESDDPQFVANVQCVWLSTHELN